MTNPEALFGVVPFGRVDFGLVRHGEAWHGGAWLERGMEYGEDWLGLARQGIWQGAAGRGTAGRGAAWQGTRAGKSARTTNNQYNSMETTHSNALMNYAGVLYDAYMNAAKKKRAGIYAPPWAEFVCDPLNKVSVGCWIAVAKVAVKMENDARDSAL